MEELTRVFGGVPAYKNPALAVATRKLADLSEGIRRASLFTAAIIAGVETSKAWKDDYKSGTEWGETMFGLKKSQYNNLKRVGEMFVTAAMGDGGRRVYCTKLAHEDGADYNLTQLVKLLPLGLDRAKDLDERGVIAPHMSVRAMADAIKEDEEREAAEAEAEAAEAEAEAAEAAEAEAAEAAEAETAEAAEAEETPHGDNAIVNYVGKYVIVTLESGEAYRFKATEWAKHMEVKFVEK